MYRILCLLLLSASAFAGKPSDQSAVNVVELYTSQGCYSCPPADKFLGELAKRDDIIAFSCHVTYWNYLGWKDTFSRPFCDNRQRQYLSVLKGYKGVYTPQMVINGRYGGVGSQRHNIHQLLERDRREGIPLGFIKLKVRESKLVVALPSLVKPESHKRQLFLLGTTGEHWLPINSGENAGKRLPYFHPIEYVKNIGQWDGQAATLTWALPDNPAIRDWLVVAQVWPVGDIVAAGKVSSNRDVSARVSK